MKGHEISSKEAINQALKKFWMGKKVQVWGWHGSPQGELKTSVGTVTKVWHQKEDEIAVCLDGKLALTGGSIFVFKIQIVNARNKWK